MKHSLDLFNDILFLNLRPWLMSKNPDLKFKQLIKDVKREYYVQQPKYEIAFVKPLSSIRKYYCAIIEAESIRFLNDFHSEIETTYSDSEISYLVHHVLNKKFSQFLKDIAKLISEKKYSSDQFDLGSNNFSKDRCIADESYILHFLKCSFIRLFLEIQDSYFEFLNEEIVTQEEIYYKYFNENHPSLPTIIAAENFPNTSPIVKSNTKEVKPPFNPIKDDLRQDNKKVLLFDKIIKNPSRFSHIEVLMFEKELIDENYNFKDKYGLKKYLAALYHQLIRKGYFNKRHFPENKAVEPLMIRQFLDYRYNTHIDKQFRNWDNDQSGLLEFIEQDYWLDDISNC
jgi:hypothetical protein